MPWKPEDAPAKTKKADSPVKRRQWADVANDTLKRTGDEARAVREANAVVKQQTSRKLKK